MNYKKYIVYILLFISACSNIAMSSTSDYTMITYPVVTLPTTTITSSTESVVISSYCSGSITRWNYTGIQHPVRNYTMACPVEWAGDLIYWNDHYWLCQDTGAYDSLPDNKGTIRPHLDYYSGNCQESVAFGIRDFTVQRVNDAVLRELGIDRTWLLPQLNTGK